MIGTILQNTTENNVLNIARFSTLNIPGVTNMQQYIGLISLKAQVSAYNQVFIIAAIIVFVGSFWALKIKLKGEEKSSQIMMMD